MVYDHFIILHPEQGIPEFLIDLVPGLIFFDRSEVRRKQHDTVRQVLSLMMGIKDQVDHARQGVIGFIGQRIVISQQQRGLLQGRDPCGDLVREFFLHGPVFPVTVRVQDIAAHGHCQEQT